MIWGWAKMGVVGGVAEVNKPEPEKGGPELEQEGGGRKDTWGRTAEWGGSGPASDESVPLGGGLIQEHSSLVRPHQGLQRGATINGIIEGMVIVGIKVMGEMVEGSWKETMERETSLMDWNF